MWVPKLLISPVIIRIFCPKPTKFRPNLAFLSIAGSFGALLVGWLVVVARAVSRKTPIYFIIYYKISKCILQNTKWKQHKIFVFFCGKSFFSRDSFGLSCISQKLGKISTEA